MHAQEVVGGGGGGGGGYWFTSSNTRGGGGGGSVHTRAPSLQTQAPCETLQSRLDWVAPRGSVNLALHRQREALVAHPALVSNESK
jgi:hypothetical protein